MGYRWESPSEFVINLPKENNLLAAKSALKGKENEEKRYLLNVLENCPNILVYHRAGPAS